MDFSVIFGEEELSFGLLGWQDLSPEPLLPSLYRSGKWRTYLGIESVQRKSEPRDTYREKGFPDPAVPEARSSSSFSK